MKILVIGSGGREHAIAWKVAQNKDVNTVFCAPGNGGTALEEKCINVDIEDNDIDNLTVFAEKENIDLTIVGPEVPLVDGIVNKFKGRGLAIFGPDAKAAQLEGSKTCAKDFMKKYGVKTAEYGSFKDADSALDYIKKCSYPLVVKADGLAAGKGVAICQNYEEASSKIREFMIDDIFTGSGKTVVIEEFLEGVEASILSITDGKCIIPFISAKDHKQIYDGGKGPNTGGMGAIAPNPYCNEAVLKDFEENIMAPTLEGIKSEHMDYKGIIFFGVMITKKGSYLLEYNVRMGDPETQAVLPLMDSDLVELINSALNGKLSNFNLKWKNGASCCVVAASKGYPLKYETGFKVDGIEEAGNVFASGLRNEDGVFKTSGGRVLCTYGIGNTLDSAVKIAYDRLDKIKFSGKYFRTDIGE
ncbi:phosphoribosylamine--glycine ligase [Clostridium tyrobutyricum]|uniref:phosphoribosylamine--glycine ligase n=1 Tax=Clostridium tyrobutyricum TaxID=1519 RepID=UPI002012A30D|nr:phosphoribosylamine--glycine ligase [Clostridium tyrobutyricum]MBR9647919.1 phosphoribosylamine--glycine ligase [Clostridium tyrobutyricum]